MTNKQLIQYAIDENGKISRHGEHMLMGGSLPFGFEGEPIYDFWKQKELDIPEDLRVAFASRFVLMAKIRWDLSRPEYQIPEILNVLADYEARR
jgi:hypothetical protein